MFIGIGMVIVTILGFFLLTAERPTGRVLGGVIAVPLIALGVVCAVVAGSAIDQELDRTDRQIRAAVLAKYDVKIQEWGDYAQNTGLELASIWKINGENV